MLWVKPPLVPVMATMALGLEVAVLAETVEVEAAPPLMED